MEILKFYTDTCMPCKAVSKALDKIEGIKVTPVNASEDVVMLDRYDVFTTPTLIFLKDGKEVARSQGLISEAKIREIVEANK